MSAMDILKGLEEPKEQTALKADTYAYYKYWEYLERMNSVIGRENYFPSYRDIQMHTLPNGQVFMTCHCHIDVYDADRNVILSSDGYGSKEIEKSSNSGAYLHLNNIAYFCQQNAFSDACRELNIFSDTISGDKRTNSVANGNSDSSKNDVRAYSNGSRDGSKDKVLKFILTGGLNKMSVDRDGKAAYSVYGYEVVSLGVRSEIKAEILFYPNQYSKCVDKFNAFCESRSCESVTDVACVMRVSETSRSTLASPRYVFKGFA